MAEARATAEGTAAYARRFEGGFAPGWFRPAVGLTVSSLGLGTYLGRADETADRGYVEAIAAAVEGGVNVIDTAVNYRLERSERAVGSALRDLLARGFRREEVVVATKGGYVPSREPEAYFRERIVRAGLARADELVAGCHCLAPGYLRHQLETSLDNLGLEAVDVYYLHNPEQQLDEVAPDEFRGRMRAAFELLEAEAARGRIGVYGTATWNGYRVPPDAPGALSLETLVGLAREVGGEGHRFRVVQLPLNLAMPEALVQPTQLVGGEAMPLLRAAAGLGIVVMTSASILQGRLARGLPPAWPEAMGSLATDAQRALQFSRSASGVGVALVGMGRTAHVRENLVLRHRPPLSPEGLAALVRPG